MAASIQPVEVVSVVKKMLAGSGLEDEISPETPLLSSGIVDSLSVAELAEELASAFSVEVELEDLAFDNADTAIQIANLLSSRQ